MSYDYNFLLIINFIFLYFASYKGYLVARVLSLLMEWVCW